MKVNKLTRTLEIIYGLILLVFGLNAFFMFMGDANPGYNESAMTFMTALFSTGYFVPVMGIIFILSGVAYIFNKYVSFGNLLLLPIMVNILLFHLFLDFTGFWMALIFVALNVYMIVIYWKNYKNIFEA